MVEFKKILVPTDFSEGSEVAYSVAQSIADSFGGTIDFIHVIPTLKYVNESIKRLGLPLDMNEDVYPKIIDESEARLDKAMESYLKKENRGSHLVKINRRPSEAIAEYADNHDYDMIIIGMHGRDETKLVRGGTVERVIRKSRVPVFSVDARFDKNNVNDIVMPTDTSKMSLVSFPLAVAVADAFNAELTLLHVMELYGSESENIPIDPKKGESVTIYEALIDRINNYLSEQGIEHLHVQRTGVTYEDEVTITDQENSRSIRLTTRIEKGLSAHYEIEAFAAENSDMIVMATHGHTGFKHLILGSTAEKVAQYVEKPVISIRPEKEEFKA
ncbi:MAG: universal stress protein [Bacteroidetes bacterium]|jgi:nucleotide-binding universal stress UspA family protein|nr:universal stress protein [Bacteroidota bacterium]